MTHRPNYKLSELDEWERSMAEMPKPPLEWVSVAVVLSVVTILCSVLIWGML